VGSSSRVVAITGASAGIGRVTALRLARDGTAVAICARRDDKLRSAAEDITRAGGRSLTLVADVAHDGDMERFVARTVEQFGRLDVMICNAGFGIAGTVDEVPADKVRRIIEVNYLGTYFAAHAALPIFRRQGHGHLIIVSSIVGKRGVPYMGIYSATKFAQVGLAECLRAELCGTAINVSIVYPVSTDTEFFDVMERETGRAVGRAFGPRQSPDVVADAIARAIDRPTPEVYPHKAARGLVVLNAIAPGFCDRFVKKFGRKPIE
jgi:short-subunit dehydrogenase